MDKKTLSLTLFAFLMIAMFAPVAFAHEAPFPTGYDATHAVNDTIGEPETVDPAWCYDTGSGEVIFNVYDTLVFYDNVMATDPILNPNGPYTAGKGDRWKPQLATDVNILPGPGDYVKTFYFKIRGTGSNAHTFVPTTGVKLFDETDPDYGKAGRQKSDVNEVNVPDKQYTSSNPTVVMDTTWLDTTPGAGSPKWVLRSYTDVGPAGLSAGDEFDVVRECHNNPKGPWWNVREYWTVDTVVGTTITTTDPPVLFQNGAALTPADVEYSFERGYVQDRAGGPTWMLWYPTLGAYEATAPGDDPNFGAVIDDMVGSNATHAWISLKTDFPETTFLQILAQSWSSIVNKAWCVAKGDFDGNWAASWETIYNTWHAPTTSHIEGDMMGTGPFAFSYWEEGTAYSVVRNTNYWNGWPALVTATGKERIGGYLDRVSWFLKTNWDDRRARFLAGDADFTQVPRQYRDQVLGQVVGGEPIRCVYPVEPSLTVDANFYNYNINPQSPYLGPGFNPATPHALGPDRIPVDLFNDPHVRTAFTAAFDYNTFLAAAYLGEATQPADPIVPGLSYDNVAQAKPVLDLDKAEAEMRLAYGGQLWTTGFHFTLSYNSGNVARQTAVTMLKNNIESLNDLFKLDVQEIAWGSAYLPQMVARMLPLFSIGWLVDYPDPDNFAFPFMHSLGTFAQYQSYSNARVDALIEAGALMPEDTAPYAGELDQPDPRAFMNNYNLALIQADPHNCIPPDTRWPRRSIYYELQALYVEDSPGFCLDQPTGRGFQQAWTRGWYYNPIYTGVYFYHRWKAVTHFGDANNDGVVGLADGAVVSASWTKPTPASPLGPLGYNTKADLTGGTGGTPDAGTGLVVGITDGMCGIGDAALVSAYWDGPPQGPSHP